MRKSARQAAVLAALALAVSGCAQQGTEGAKFAPGEKLKITKEVWSDYEQYVPQGRGLSPDRQGYYYCPRQYDGCRPGKNAVSDILGECRRENVERLIFAATKTSRCRTRSSTSRHI